MAAGKLRTCARVCGSELRAHEHQRRKRSKRSKSRNREAGTAAAPAATCAAVSGDTSRGSSPLLLRHPQHRAPLLAALFGLLAALLVCLEIAFPSFASEWGHDERSL